MFKTMFGKHKRYYIESGSGEQKEFKIDGNKLIQTGTKNLYDEIQSHKEECDIEQIISRVKLGDTSALREDGNYIDCTVFPKNINKVREMVKDAENEFFKLPIEVRNAFGNDFDKYMEAYGTEEFKKILMPGTTKKEKQEKIETNTQTKEGENNE